MTIDEKEEEVISEFAIYDEWMDKYAYLIELGKDLPIIKEEYKTKDRLIKGCQSQVWLHGEKIDDKMYYTADSDAIITRGVIALLIRVINGEEPATVAGLTFNFIKEIGLQEHLSPTRSNGLLSMIKEMKLTAIKEMRP